MTMRRCRQQWLRQLALVSTLILRTLGNANLSRRLKFTEIPLSAAHSRASSRTWVKTQINHTYRLRAEYCLLTELQFLARKIQMQPQSQPLLGPTLS